jgi:hypothetical protein
MSYLDELKQQAAEVRAKEEQEAARQAHLAAHFDAAVKPGLRRLHLYMRDLCEHLNYIKPDIVVDYTLEHFGKISRLSQGDYITSNYDEEKNSFFVRFVCTSAQKLNFNCHSQMLIKILNDYL